MKISEVITKLVKTITNVGDVDVINIDCDGNVTYNNKVEYVDLGLPSGTKWAKCNYGTNNETESGKYYTWDKAQKLPITLPTKEQFCELVKNTTSVWVENYDNSGVNGRLFISKKNRNTLFVPAASYCGNNSVYSVGSSGCVWSSSLYSSYPYFSYISDFKSSYVNPQNDSLRLYGFSVRGVSQ